MAVPEIKVIKGDITTLHVDAIVNAANSSLMGGGGVDGAIHRAGGPQILEECKKIREAYGPCHTGEAVITSAGRLPAKAIIHTVGPIWKNGMSGEPEKLSNCYKNSLKLAENKEFRSVAFPNISTGVYGYPKTKAAKIAQNAVRAFKYYHIKKVIFVCFDDENYNLYTQKI